jgi:TPR repeat protein
VVKDEVEAVKWYRQAAGQNHAVAQSDLGVCYAEGRGVVKDQVEAYAWFSLATATIRQAASFREFLARSMSPEQIVAGYKRTKELRAIIAANLKRSGD